MAQHLTNTVFIDRAIIVTPIQSGDVPDERDGLIMATQVTSRKNLCLFLSQAGSGRHCENGLILLGRSTCRDHDLTLGIDNIILVQLGKV